MASIVPSPFFELAIAGISGINILLVMYLIRSSNKRQEDFQESLKGIQTGFNKSLSEIKNSIPEQLDKAINRFDKLCTERQAACSAHQQLRAESVCSKLNQYAIQNDKLWNDLAKRREIAWANHEREMEKIWETIRHHSH